MRKLIFTLVISIGLCSLNAGVKNIEKHFRTKSTQTIEIKELSGGNIRIKTWDKDEVSIKLKLEFNSSKEEYEYKYLKAADVVAYENESNLKICYKTIGEEGKWSYFLGIKYNFMYHESSELSGEIYIPKKNPLKTDFSYGKIILADMNSPFELTGSSNELEIINCSKLSKIGNNYGKVKIENCTGDLILGCASGKIEINNLRGSLKINGNYSEITLNDISQKTEIYSTSGKHYINNIMGDLIVNSNYSTVNINNIAGFADIKDASGTVIVRKTEGLSIDANYSKIQAYDISLKTGKEINIRSTSGKLLMENICGNVHINNSYSEMIFKNIKSNVSVHGTSSSITADNITGNWISETSYSKTLLRNISSKNVKIKNSSENIEVDFDSAPKELDVRNSYGTVKIFMPLGFSGKIDLDSQYGSIKSNLPLAITKRSSSATASGQIGSGTGYIKLSASSGDVILNQK